MRIFSKKSFRFEMEEQKPVSVKPMEFKDVPDWVKSTYLFKLAKKDGSVEEIVSREQKLQIENNGETDEERELRERGKELKIKNYQRLAIDKLRGKIAEAEGKSEENETEKSGGETGEDSFGENNSKTDEGFSEECESNTEAGE